MNQRHAYPKKGPDEIELTGNKPTGGLQTLLEKLSFCLILYLLRFEWPGQI